MAEQSAELEEEAPRSAPPLALAVPQLEKRHVLGMAFCHTRRSFRKPQEKKFEQHAGESREGCLESPKISEVQ